MQSKHKTPLVVKVKQVADKGCNQWCCWSSSNQVRSPVGLWQVVEIQWLVGPTMGGCINEISS